MTKILEPVDTGSTSMNAVTEPLPRVVILTSHPDYLTTKPLPIVREHPRVSEPRPPARRPSSAAPRSTPRAHAPRSLRFIVFVLMAVFLAGMGGVVTEQMHPRWFASLENYIHPPALTVRAHHGQILSRAMLISSSPAAVTYSVPATSYSIVISVDHPCWFIVRSPAGGSSILREMTMSLGTSPMSIRVHGSSSIMVAAQTLSIKLIDGAKVLEVLQTPRAGTVYSFLPKP